MPSVPTSEPLRLGTKPRGAAPSRRGGARLGQARLAGALLLVLLICPVPADAQAVRILVQASPLAGSQYYALERRYGDMQVGDTLTLTREPDNPHDRHAVRVDWRGDKLGYLPRAENRAVAAAMDQGLAVEGRIAALTPHPNPWQRLRVEVWIAPD